MKDDPVPINIAGSTKKYPAFKELAIEHLKQLRDKIDSGTVSTVELARLLGVSRPTIVSWLQKGIWPKGDRRYSVYNKEHCTVEEHRLDFTDEEIEELVERIANRNSGKRK